MSGSSAMGAMSIAPEWPAGGLEEVSRCPNCDGTGRRLLYAELADRRYGVPGQWTLHRCTSCGVAYLDPRPTEQTIGLAYRNYYTHASPTVSAPDPPSPLRRAQRRLRQAYLNNRFGYRLGGVGTAGASLSHVFPVRRARADRSVRHLRHPGGAPKLLDVGCGNGRFVGEMRECGWLADGIDPDPAAVDDALQARLPARRGTLDDVVRDSPPASYDAITIAHVIEHVPFPAKDIRRCFGLLRPGGLLWIATPNLESPAARIYRRDWSELDPPRHLVLFNRAALVATLQAEGFTAIANPPGPASDEFLPASHALRRGGDPFGLAAPWHVRAIAAAADALSLVAPQYSEELVLLATKPSPD